MRARDHYAVFGHPIQHSLSPRIHTLFAQQTGQHLDYVAQDVPADQFDSALASFIANGGHGLNCTLPLKELAWRSAQQLSERAQRAKAVNTLRIDTDGRLFGDNTDGLGLVNDLCRNAGINLHGQRILILGAGGAVRGILQPLLLAQPDCIVIANRTADKAVSLAAEFVELGAVSGGGWEQFADRQFDLILNGTAASLHGELPPLPAALLANNGVCYDLAYGQTPTAFVEWGRRVGAALSLDGLGMLVEQAAAAFELWRGVAPDTAPVIAQLKQSRGF